MVYCGINTVNMGRCRYIIQITLICVAVVQVDGAQQFLEMPSYTEVDPGADALLKCRISEKKGICSWQKDNKPLGMYRGKYEWISARSRLAGDCSLWIRAARLRIDDGSWQCQVTASNYKMQDALSSNAALLVVRVSPHSPQIIYNESFVAPEAVFTIPTLFRATVVCEARYGNPPAIIEWFIDKNRMTAWNQSNEPELNQPRMWSTRSVLELSPTRSDHGKQLVCRAHHASYPPPYYHNVYAKLNVLFVPTVSIAGSDINRLSSLEDGASSLSLYCKAVGNPKPYVWWTKDGEIFSKNSPELFIETVSRNDSGIYGCQAENTVGVSDSVNIVVDVKFAPRIQFVGSDRVLNADLNSHITLECIAEGNPQPSYEWYYWPMSTTFDNNSQDAYLIASESFLQLFNVSYSVSGRYFCIAKNFINHQKRTHRSASVTVNVLGPPVSLRALPAHGWRLNPANIFTTVCANPPPKTAFWSWSDIRLNVPSETGRFKALEYENVNYCYYYTLIVIDVRSSDAGSYVLKVENERGFISQSILLTVHETAHVAPVITTCLLLAVLIVMLFCIVVRCRWKKDFRYKNDAIKRRGLPKGKHKVLPFVTSLHEGSNTLSKTLGTCTKNSCEEGCKGVNNSVALLTYKNILESQDSLTFKQTIKEPFPSEEYRHNYEEISDFYRAY